MSASAPPSLVLTPLVVWDGDEQPAEYRSTMSVRWPESRETIKYEAWQLDAFAVVLEVDVSARDIGAQGTTLRRLPATPRLRLTLSVPGGEPMVFRAAGNTSPYLPDWECNARALALTLEGLRALDRWGVAGRGRGAQYAGFAALPPGGSGVVVPAGGSTPAVHGAAWARSVIADIAGVPGVDESVVSLGELLRAAKTRARLTGRVAEYEEAAAIFRGEPEGS